MSKSKTKNSTNNQETPISKSNSAKAGSTGGQPAGNQLIAFDSAMKLFHKRDFQGALPSFDEAAKGTDVSIAHTAQLHANMCRQRLERESPQLKTSEDNYAFGLALANRRELTGAEKYLQRALQLAPKADHILYSLALVKGLQGDMPAAAGYLAQAIEIQPSNRSTARTDPDFHELLRHQPIREIVF
jgi:tetratricopeptide (TPR) repeat protein